jgi:sec-independent protein translocase protein TatA
MWKPGVFELVILLIVVLLVFGVGRISKLGKELGTGIREFRDGLTGESGAQESDQSDEE